MPLDIKFSKYIRTKAGWRCENCNRIFIPPTAGLQCSHFHGRRKKSVRFDPDNVAALCFSCHRHFTENPYQHTEWFKKRLGEKRYNALMLRANTPGKPDYEMIKLFLKNEESKHG